MKVQPLISTSNVNIEFQYHTLISKFRHQTSTLSFYLDSRAAEIPIAWWLWVGGVTRWRWREGKRGGVAEFDSLYMGWISIQNKFFACTCCFCVRKRRHLSPVQRVVLYRVPCRKPRSSIRFTASWKGKHVREKKSGNVFFSRGREVSELQHLATIHQIHSFQLSDLAQKDIVKFQEKKENNAHAKQKAWNSLLNQPVDQYLSKHAKKWVAFHLSSSSPASVAMVVFKKDGRLCFCFASSTSRSSTLWKSTKPTKNISNIHQKRPPKQPTTAAVGT